MIETLAIGDAGTAGEVEGPPAMLAVPQPDTMIDAGEYGPLIVRAASVRGVGHRYDGTPRQDDFCLGVGGASNEWFVVAVADGVSSGPTSHVASRAAVRFVIKLLNSKLASSAPSALDWNEVIGGVAGFVLAQARNESRDPHLDAGAAAKLMATTIVIAVVPVYPNSAGVRSCAVLAVGDTSAWVLGANGQWRSETAIKNDGAAVASSATAALPLLPPGDFSPISVELGPGEVLFVMTDGVGDPLGDGKGEVGRSLARAWSDPPDRYTFASQVDFRRRSHTDDRTVVGIWTGRGKASGEDPAAGFTVEPVETGSVPGVAGSAAPVGSSYVPPAGVLDETTSESGTGGTAQPQDEPSENQTWAPTPWTPTPWNPS